MAENLPIRRTLAKILPQQEFEIIQIPRSSAVFDGRTLQGIELVIADFLMEELNGGALALRMRVEGHNQPVILLYSQPFSVNAMAALRNVYLVRKPFSHRSLMRLVRALFAGMTPPLEISEISGLHPVSMGYPRKYSLQNV